MKKFAVIGLGKFGFHAAKALFEDGNEVIAIDTDRNKVQAIDPFATEAIILNAMDKEALRSLGLEEMDAVIVSTGTSSRSRTSITPPEHIANALSITFSSSRTLPGKL